MSRLSMNIFRVYACDSRLIDRRLELLIESTGCCTACGHYQRLTPEEVADSAGLDDRFENDRNAVRRLERMAADGYSVYLLEVWCRIEGFCPYRQSCHPEPQVSSSQTVEFAYTRQQRN